MQTARAKGLSERLVLGKHALRNALDPGGHRDRHRLADLLVGAPLTETVFAWPGLGRLLVAAVGQRDLPVVMGAVLVFALSTSSATCWWTWPISRSIRGSAVAVARSAPAGGPVTRPPARHRRGARGRLRGVALLAPVLASYDPTRCRPRSRVMLEPPGPRIRFGTDALGRDLLSRVLSGGASPSRSASGWKRWPRSWRRDGPLAGYYGGCAIAADARHRRGDGLSVARPRHRPHRRLRGAGARQGVISSSRSAGRPSRGSCAAVLSLVDRDYVQAARALGAGPGDDPLASPPAQRAGPPAGRRDDRHGRQHGGRGRPVLPRPRRATPDDLVGPRCSPTASPT